jgi:hypothetical protein
MHVRRARKLVTRIAGHCGARAAGWVETSIANRYVTYVWSLHSQLRREEEITLLHSCAERVVALCCLVLYSQSIGGTGRVSGELFRC